MDELLYSVRNRLNNLVTEVRRGGYRDMLGHSLVNNTAYVDAAEAIAYLDIMVGKEPEPSKQLKPSKQEEMLRYLEPVKGKEMISYAKYEELIKGEFQENYYSVSPTPGRGVVLRDDIVICPTYMTDKAVGADCFASEDATIQPGAIEIVPTGVKARFNGSEEGLFPFIRSSIPRKKGLLLANGVGVVESDYADNPDNDGNIGFMFLNFGSEAVTIKRFERIGQIVLLPILRFENAGYAGMERGASGSTGK